MGLIRRTVLLLALVALAGCRVDVVVDLALAEDGTGELTVTATADADVVEQVPGLAQDLRFDDAVAAGWAVDHPVPTEDGGLTMMLRHDVAAPDQATTLLRSVGPPFEDLELTRTVDGDSTEYELSGSLVLANGFDSFTDTDLLQAVGGTPFADDLAATGATPARSMAVRFRAALPGAVEQTTAQEVDGALEWQAPLDASALDVATRTVQRPGATWASVVSVTALALLVVWALLALAVIVSVIRVRGRRARRRGLGAASARRLEDLGARP